MAGKGKKNKVDKFMKIMQALWGKDSHLYNTITNTTCCSLVVLQTYRMFALLVMFGLFCVNIYIYVKTFLVMYHCWALFFSFCAFLFLFIGAGKQKVY